MYKNLVNTKTRLEQTYMQGNRKKEVIHVFPDYSMFITSHLPYLNGLWRLYWSGRFNIACSFAFSNHTDQSVVYYLLKNV